MAAWAAREPDDEYHVIAGAGHCANLDRPAEANALVAAFLEAHASTGVQTFKLSAARRDSAGRSAR